MTTQEAINEAIARGHDAMERSQPAMDIAERAREYLANNAAESGADVLIAGLVAEVEALREAAKLWADAAQGSTAQRYATAEEMRAGATA
jgi:hypothetical protein